MISQYYDRIIIGAGLYGLYSAEFSGRQGIKTLTLECESAPFKRATYINQARVHQGYHYPRSLSTAIKSAGYFRRFNEDYSFCINKEFYQIYATSRHFSWTDGKQFLNFCRSANIPCEELHPNRFFKDNVCDGAFQTREYTYDALILRDYLVECIQHMNSVDIIYQAEIDSLYQDGKKFYVILKDGREFSTKFLLNATYASTNQIIDFLGYNKFKIKYELCEIILCDVGEELKNYGFTVMDGPFFSIMPFGKTGMHSLTSVTFTPHTTSFEATPTFPCQSKSNGFCNSKKLGNCNICKAKPNSAYPYMRSLAKKYLKDKFEFEYKESLFSMKPILVSSEMDDSRPTVVKVFTKNPTFISILSGKINTVYDLDEVLNE